MILVFSVIYLDSWEYIGWGPPSEYLKSFVLSFLFFSSFSFLLFSILHFLFCLSLGGPFSSGPLDIVHPCHPVATPLMVWVNHLLDDSYSSLWKTIEVDFHCDVDILWKSYAPESFLTKLKNNQLADSIRTWYIFRAKAVKNWLDLIRRIFLLKNFYGLTEEFVLSPNSFFDYQDWYDKGISPCCWFNECSRSRSR